MYIFCIFFFLFFWHTHAPKMLYKFVRFVVYFFLFCCWFFLRCLRCQIKTVSGCQKKNVFDFAVEEVEKKLSAKILSFKPCQHAANLERFTGLFAKDHIAVNVIRHYSIHILHIYLAQTKHKKSWLKFWNFIIILCFLR